MKKYFNKISKKIRINKTLFIFLVTLVLFSVAAGAIFSSIINDSDKKLVTEYLNNFITNVKNNNIIQENKIFTNMIFTNGFSLAIWILGISLIGIILVLPLLFLKGFILGFTIGSMMVNLKYKGIVLSLIYIIPHNLINILIYMLISAYAIIISHKLIKSVKNRKIFDFKKIMNKYTYILYFTQIVLLLTTLYETYILPYLMKIIVKII